MKTIQGQYRQGDVLVEEVSEIPKTAKKLEREGGLVVLARGEATGHHHSFAAKNVQMFMHGEDRYVVIDGRQAPLMHQEHAPIPMRPANRVVTIQREFMDEMIRNVAD